MQIYEFRLQGKPIQFQRIEEAIRTTQFIRNKCLRFWLTGTDVKPYDLNKYCAVLAEEFEFARKLNSQARQAAAERAAAAIKRFLEHCAAQPVGTKGFPRFQQDCRSVEYKTSGWKLAADRKRITLTDGQRIGTLKLVGTRDLLPIALSQFKRVRLVRQADGYYVQFCVEGTRQETVPPAGVAVGLDVGLRHFYTDSEGQAIESPKLLRQAEKQLQRLHRKVSSKVKGSANRRQARHRLGRAYLKVSRQRKDFVVKAARCVVKSNDFIVYEDLQIANMVKHHSLAKSIHDAAWGQFAQWLKYYGQVWGKVVVAVPPQYTSQDCSGCGARVQKTLSTRTHQCPRCKLNLDRDHNAALNILAKGLALLSHPELGRGTPESTPGESVSDLAGKATLAEPGIPRL